VTNSFLWPSFFLPILLPVCRLFPLLIPVLLLQTQGRATPLQHQPGRRPRSCLAKVQFVPPPRQKEFLLVLIYHAFSFLDFSSSCQQGEKKGDKIKQRKVDSQVMGELICPCFFPWSYPVIRIIFTRVKLQTKFCSVSVSPYTSRSIAFW
jgi:hypothetical protein